ncbi:MAG: site-2 protease family protein, partial [Planctomycetaceae bacterium]
TPLAFPAIGLAYQVQTTVLAVDQEGPADAAGIKPLDAITKLELVLPEGAEPDGLDENLTFDIGESNLAHAFWQMQQLPARRVRLTVQSSETDTARTVDVTPVAATDWFLPTTRGLQFFGLSQSRQAENASQAFHMGWHYTRSSILNIYLTLQNLFTGRLSVKELHGPLGIISVAGSVAQVSLAELLRFLGFLSINLAVLNFLPIPILDGGHMIFLMWEGVSRRRPSERVVVAATLAGVTFIVGLMALVLWQDITRIFQGTL